MTANRSPARFGSEAMDQQHQQRSCEIELLFDAERPGMQQRLGFGRSVEISGGLRKIDIRDRRHGAGEAPRVIHELNRQAIERGQNAGDQEHHEQRRQNAQDPALVEIGERERSFADVRVDHAADQISGNDKEDIDADKAAGKAGDADMVEQHGNDGDRAQAVDVGAVLGHLGLTGRAKTRRRKPLRWWAPTVAKGYRPDRSAVPKRTGGSRRTSCEKSFRRKSVI